MCVAWFFVVIIIWYYNNPATKCHTSQIENQTANGHQWLHDKQWTIITIIVDKCDYICILAMIQICRVLNVGSFFSVIEYFLYLDYDTCEHGKHSEKVNP